MRNLQDYLNLFAIFYSYFGAIEQLVNDHLRKDSFPDYMMRREAVEKLLEQIYTVQNYLKTHGAPGVFNKSLHIVKNVFWSPRERKVNDFELFTQTFDL